MGQFSLDWNADGNEPGEDPGANAAPDSATQSSGSQLAGGSNPVGDAARGADANRADANRADASLGGGMSPNAQSNPPIQSGPPQLAQPPPSQFDQSAKAPANPQSAVTQQPAGIAPADSGDTLAQAGPPGAASIPRPRQPVKQIGQIPVIDDTQLLQRYTGPVPQTAAEAEQQHAAWMQLAEESQAQQQQIAQINASDPYIADEDGRWKKQTADPATGAIHEMDVLDTGTGKIDRGTGNIYVQTSQGPQVIGIDPQQKRLAQMVEQKGQAQAQGSPISANIAAARSALLDTQQQLQSFQGIPERMSVQIGKYTQASPDSKSTAAATQLQSAQAALHDWKQQNPRYAALCAKRDALANQIQTQIAAKAKNDLQVAQLLTTPQYAQWNGNMPPSPGTAGQHARANGFSGASAITTRDLDARAGIIAAQTGFPAGLAYSSALGEAQRHGAQTLDGSPIEDAIKGVQPAAQAQLLKMSPTQLRQAFQSGLITQQQARTAAMAHRAAQDQPAVTPDDGGQPIDPVAQSIADLAAKAAKLRTRIQTAFDTGGPGGVKDLATYRAALADTESQLHAATRTLLNRVPAVMQQRIVKAVAPNPDWDATTLLHAQDPIAHFATENLGSALRDQTITPDLRQRIRRLAISRGINPDLADHVANQAVGANAVSDLLAVLRGGNIGQIRAEILQDMGFLRQSDPNDPTSPLHLTEDAQRLLTPGAQSFVQLKPDMARYTPSPDPAHGSVLYQNAVAGMERFSNTAERMLPAPIPKPEAEAAPSVVVEKAQTSVGHNASATFAPETVNAIPGLSHCSLQPGPYAAKSIPARSAGRSFTEAERDAINQIGGETGCHTCGNRTPGTKSGNFVPDHQPISALNANNAPQRLYPHCIHCSRKQGLAVARQMKDNKP